MVLNREKVLARLDRFRKVEAAISDIPNDLMDAIKEEWEIRLREFPELLYKCTKKDLRKLEVDKKTYTHLSDSEIRKIVDEGSALMVHFKYKKQKGIFLIGKYDGVYRSDRNPHYWVEIDRKIYNFVSGRLEPFLAVLNIPGLKYKAWILSFPDGDVSDKVKNREETRKSMPWRYPFNKRNTELFYDKNGYIIDIDKYNNILYELKKGKGKWAKEVEFLMSEFVEIQKDIMYAKKMNLFRSDLKKVMEKINEAVMCSLDETTSDGSKERAFKEAKKFLEELDKRMIKEGI